MKIPESGYIKLHNIFSNTALSLLIKEYESSLLNLTEKDNIGEGRFDIALNQNIISKIEPQILKQIVKVNISGDILKYIGGLPSFPSSSDGDWHRDTYQLFSEKINLALPTYYITVLIPLHNLTKKRGLTELLIGSQTVKTRDFHKLKSIAPLLKKGDVLVMEGRLYHRGIGNTSLKSRDMVYITYCKKWYRDY